MHILMLPAFCSIIIKFVVRSFSYNCLCIVHNIFSNISTLIYIIFDRVWTYNFQYIFYWIWLSLQIRQL